MISKSMLGYRPSFHSVTIDITSEEEYTIDIVVIEYITTKIIYILEESL